MRVRASSSLAAAPAALKASALAPSASPPSAGAGPPRPEIVCSSASKASRAWRCADRTPPAAAVGVASWHSAVARSENISARRSWQSNVAKRAIARFGRVKQWRRCSRTISTFSSGNDVADRSRRRCNLVNIASSCSEPSTPSTPSSCAAQSSTCTSTACDGPASDESPVASPLRIRANCDTWTESDDRSATWAGGAAWAGRLP